MLIMIRNTQEKKVIENARGGIGSIEMHTKITKEDQVEGLSLFAKVVVTPIRQSGIISILTMRRLIMW